MATATTATKKKTTAKKTTTTKATTAKATTATKKKVTASAAKTTTAKKTTTTAKKKAPCANTFPREELLSWLSTHSYWNHWDWENLIEDLKAQGYTDYINTNGVNEIGFFLETHRS